MAEQCRILIVEDASDIRYLLRKLFEAEGFDVQHAGNGQEALSLLHASDPLPHVILLDLMMPIMDGYEFRSRQDQDPRLSGIPVLIMTADGESTSKKETLKAKEFLSKPVDIQRLLTLVRSSCP